MTRRAALVTGGGRGIGAAIAIELARRGADVAVNYRRDAESAATTVEAIEALGSKGRAYGASIDSVEECQALVAHVLEDFPNIDLLVNNAGNASRGQSVVETDPAELDRLMRTHAFGPHHLCQGLLPALRSHTRSDVVFISSTATEYLPANGAPYNMAKAAGEALALTLAKEERGNGVRVNVVAPGLVATEMGRRLVKATNNIDDIRTLDPQMPFGRVCRPEDVARVVGWIISDDASYITGHRVRVDGGGEW